MSNIFQRFRQVNEAAAAVKQPKKEVVGTGLEAHEKLDVKDPEIALSPDFENEYFISTLDYKGRYIIFKKIGLGMNKPIRVYIDDEPWEIFPEIKAATKQVKIYLDRGLDKKGKKDGK